MAGGFNLPQRDGSLLPPPDGSAAPDAGHDDAAPEGGELPDAAADDAGPGGDDLVEPDGGGVDEEVPDAGALDAGDAGSPDVPDAGSDAGRDAGFDAGVASALSGTFITKSSVASKIDQLGLSPNPQVAPASQYFVITYQQAGKHLKFSTKICYLDLPDTKAVGGARVTETWWKKKPVSEFLPTIVSEGDFLSSPDPGAAYVPTPQTVFLGYDGSQNGNIPSDPNNDSRVYDEDGDGKKGVTLHIEGMPVIGSVDGYIVEKTITRESGTYVSANRVEGKIDNYTAEENVFDASNPVAKGNNPKITFEPNPPAKDAFGAPMPPDLNTFVSKRVDGTNGSQALLTKEPKTEAEFDAACKQLFGQACDPQNANRCWATCWDTSKNAKVKCTESNLFD
ncbi:MAG: hypothetical protein HY897_21005 [Deltaproteobacteria bacterium]|nr:hypothetical protein [Deltaproteobacteria bacterium]